MTVIGKTERASCAAALEMFCALDKGERFPLRLALHALACPPCRASFRACSRAEALLSRPLLRPVSADEAERLAAAALCAAPRAAASGPFSLRRWIASGAAMVAAMLLFAAVSPQSAGNYLQLAFYLVFGCAVTAYCALFIAGNMDFFARALETIRAPR